MRTGMVVLLRTRIGNRCRRTPARSAAGTDTATGALATSGTAASAAAGSKATAAATHLRRGVVSTGPTRSGSRTGRLAAIAPTWAVAAQTSQSGTKTTK